MKLLTFHNAPGSTVPEQFALAARHNPDHIVEMAETPSEVVELRKEALVRQYVIIVDRSGSMAISDGKGTRWDSAQMAVEKLIETVFKYDVDHRVPVYVFDDQTTFVGECTDVGQVAGIFQQYKPRGTTDLAKALDTAMEEYAGRKRPDFAQIPGTTFIVILDGSTDDNDAVIRVIKKFADPKNGYIQNHTNIAVSFVQIGDDAGATRFLQFLDDGMGEPDIVDTKSSALLFTPGGVDKLLMDAIFD
jgi:von Willebrand factor type A domain